MLAVLGDVENAGVDLAGLIRADQQNIMYRDVEQAEAPAVQRVLTVAWRAGAVAQLSQGIATFARQQVFECSDLCLGAQRLSACVYPQLLDRRLCRAVVNTLQVFLILAAQVQITAKVDERLKFEVGQRCVVVRANGQGVERAQVVWPLKIVQCGLQ